MRPNNSTDLHAVLAYVTDCTLATVSSLASKKTQSKSELSRQCSIAQFALDAMIKNNIDFSQTRGKEIVDNHGAVVMAWAKTFEPKIYEKSCKRCSFELKDGHCTSDQCLFNKHIQACPAGWRGHPNKDPHYLDDEHPMPCICLFLNNKRNNKRR